MIFPGVSTSLLRFRQSAVALVRPLSVCGEGVGGEVVLAEADLPNHLPLLHSHAVVEANKRHVERIIVSVANQTPSCQDAIAIRHLVLNFMSGLRFGTPGPRERIFICASAPNLHAVGSVVHKVFSVIRRYVGCSRIIPTLFHHEAHVGLGDVRENGRHIVNGLRLLRDQAFCESKCSGPEHVPALTSRRVGDETTVASMRALDSVIEPQPVFFRHHILGRSGQIRKAGADRVDQVAETVRSCWQVPWPVRWLGVGIYKLVQRFQSAVAPNFFNKPTDNPFIIIRHVAPLS